jgi:hypothetical protein
MRDLHFVVVTAKSPEQIEREHRRALDRRCPRGHLLSPRGSYLDASRLPCCRRCVRERVRRRGRGLLVSAPMAATAGPRAGRLETAIDVTC